MEDTFVKYVDKLWGNRNKTNDNNDTPIIVIKRHFYKTKIVIIFY